MPVVKTFGSIKRFGPRYGLRLKQQLAEVEQKQKARQRCPHCRKLAAKRQAAGLWRCKACGLEFAGGAYYL